MREKSLKTLILTLCAAAGWFFAQAVAQAAEHPAPSKQKGWTPLFTGEEAQLDLWKMKPGSWAVEDDTLARKGGGDIVTKQSFDDFLLDLEFKVAPKTNSGVAIRLDEESKPWWRNGALEIQVLDSADKEKPGKHDCGALYDLIAPKVNAAKPAGEWNRLTVKAKGSKIEVVLNGELVVDCDLDDWPEARKNPDGTPNKYKEAMKDHPRTGPVLLQDHGNPVWYRNVWVKEL